MATDNTIKRFSDGKPKPYLSSAEYAELRDDDRFLYNEGPANDRTASTPPPANCYAPLGEESVAQAIHELSDDSKIPWNRLTPGGKAFYKLQARQWLIIQSALSAMSPAWQDIATAKPGYHECIIACREGWPDSVGPVWFRDGYWHQPSGEVWLDGWLTHWMPLPKGPRHD